MWLFSLSWRTSAPALPISSEWRWWASAGGISRVRYAWPWFVLVTAPVYDVISFGSCSTSFASVPGGRAPRRSKDTPGSLCQAHRRARPIPVAHSVSPFPFLSRWTVEPGLVISNVPALEYTTSSDAGDLRPRLTSAAHDLRRLPGACVEPVGLAFPYSSADCPTQIMELQQSCAVGCSMRP